MARLKSPEKRAAILDAAVEEIAEVGLGAATAKIAASAGVAAGTLFTYFASKDELLNELYRELKDEFYARVNADFPRKASLENRLRHIWMCYLAWTAESPKRRLVSAQLHLSGVITDETREFVAEGRGVIDATFRELETSRGARTLPGGFLRSVMSAMQDTTMDYVARQPRRRKEIVEKGFELYWRAVK